MKVQVFFFSESSRTEVFCQESVLIYIAKVSRALSSQRPLRGCFRPESCNFIKKETLAQVFSCEFCEISKNTFLTEHIWTIASEFLRQLQEVKIFDWYMFIVYWFSQLCPSENCTMNLSQQENLIVLVHLQCWNKV